MKARENPFSTSRVLKLRYRLTNGEWDQLLERLAALNHRAALVGPHGAGKTTLLEDLQPRLVERGFGVHWLRLNDENRSLPQGFLEENLPGMGSRDVLLFDGAEQLSGWTWFRLKRRTQALGGLIITTHGPGRLPTLRHCATDPELLASLVGDLIGNQGSMSLEEAQSVYQHHQGNLREALRWLYDRYALGETSSSALP